MKTPLFLPMQVAQTTTPPPDSVTIWADIQGRVWSQSPNQAPVQINIPSGPSWTYTPNAIGSGLFTTDNAAIAGTTTITFSQSVLGTTVQGWTIVSGDTEMVLTNSAGACSKFRIVSIADVAGNPAVTVVFQFSAETNWSGRYAVSFIPAVV